MGIQTPSLSAIKTFKLPGRQIPARESVKLILSVSKFFFSTSMLVENFFLLT